MNYPHLAAVTVTPEQLNRFVGFFRLVRLPGKQR